MNHRPLRYLSPRLPAGPAPTRRTGPARIGPAPGGADGPILLVGGLVLLAVACVWMAGQLMVTVATGRWPSGGASAAASVATALPGHLADPRSAWPPADRAQLPGPAGLYPAAGLLALPAGVGTALVVHRRRRGTAPGQGARWARRSDLRPVVPKRRRRAGRLVVGRTVGGRPGRDHIVATESRHSVLVIGPTQSGKSSGLAIPALLEWEGPVVATSVKDDLARATLRWRSAQGPCWVFDPTRSSGLGPLSGWSPLSAATSWSDAQRTASWLVESTPGRSGLADAAFWYAAAAKQLAPLLLAAERGGGSPADLVRWNDSGDFGEPIRLLQLTGEGDAALALSACAGRDERIRSSVSTTLETVLAPLGDPVVAASVEHTEIDIAALLTGRGTLYLCGPSHEQQRVQGLFATLVSALVTEAVAETARRGAPLDPPLLLVLDEAANIAPIRDLDTLASTGAGLGIQLVTVCQDLAQLAGRYGPERSRTIANNHRAKVLLSGVSDLGTLDLLSGLAGEQAVREQSVTEDLRDGRRTRSVSTAIRRLAPTDELRRTPPGQAVLLYGHLPPVRLRLRPWYSDRRLRRRAEGGRFPEGGAAGPPPGGGRP